MSYPANIFWDQKLIKSIPYLCIHTTNDRWGKLRNQEIWKISEEYHEVSCIYLNWKFIKNYQKLSDLHMFDCYILLNNVEYEKSSCINIEKVRHIFSYVAYLVKLPYEKMLDSLKNGGFSTHVSELKSKMSYKYFLPPLLDTPPMPPIPPIPPPPEKSPQPQIPKSFLEAFQNFINLQNIPSKSTKNKIIKENNSTSSKITKKLKIINVNNQINSNKSKKMLRKYISINNKDCNNISKLIKSEFLKRIDQIKSNTSQEKTGSSSKRKQRNPQHIENIRKYLYAKRLKINNLN